ncbi:hypothetical protein JYU02_01235 [bacterium AH-315-P15]|nr:hypothetical protein [bacterium AH-315-P15]
MQCWCQSLAGGPGPLDQPGARCVGAIDAGKINVNSAARRDFEHAEFGVNGAQRAVVSQFEI